MKLLPSSFTATFSASPFCARLRASSSVFIDSKRVRFSLVARSALPFGSRKLRAKPARTRTTSPIWPSLATRSSKITSIGSSPCVFGKMSGGTGRRALPSRDAAADVEGGIGEADDGDREGRPAEQEDAQIHAAKHEGPAGERA